jgi:transposase
MRLAMEKDLETVRQAALLLEAENRKLLAKNLELQTELLKLKGLGAEQLALRLAELELQLAARNKMLFGPSSEKRHKRSKDAPPDKPQTGHGPTEQPKLRLVDAPVELGDVATTCCPHCKGAVAEWVGQFEESEEIDVMP